ncbi:MAG TPA: histidinol dehydrogenase, partial [Thiobacillus sp.]|nr:histidinol dehydrogenase [Thiobacillus sp.]
RALLKYATRFDRLQGPVELTRSEMERLAGETPRAVRAAIRAAARHIRIVARAQVPRGLKTKVAAGVLVEQRVTPLARVGCYVPGGRYPLPSSLLMTAVTARAAGVPEVIVTCPNPAPAVMAAALEAGVDRFFQIGGAQAVAAMAYGTATVPRVDKIVGPGNAYVAAAKRRVFGTVGIDMIAGPSEILVIADGNTPPEWVAMDLFSQAEHDEMAQSILLSPDAAYLDAVAAAIDKLIDEMPRSEVIRTSLTNRGALIKTRDLDDAVTISNIIAPEHLELSVADPDALLPGLRHAGAIFMGKHTCEALGDYCAGPNHVLPTSRTARFSSPLGVYDFQKRSSLINVSQAGAQTLGRIAATLAYGEGLQAHARSAEYRLVHK